MYHGGVSGIKLQVNINIMIFYTCFNTGISCFIIKEQNINQHSIRPELQEYFSVIRRLITSRKFIQMIWDTEKKWTRKLGRIILCYLLLLRSMLLNSIPEVTFSLVWHQPLQLAATSTTIQLAFGRMMTSSFLIGTTYKWNCMQLWWFNNYWVAVNHE